MIGLMIAEASLISVATAAIAWLVTQSAAFGWLRGWTAKHSRFLDKLLACGYCLSHWIAAALVVACDVRLFGMPWPLDYALTILAVAWLATFQYAAMDRLW